jgi:exonuclease SbcC
MENFGPFVGKTVIDFTTLDEIFLITGKTGSGKTSVFDALCFALYGTVPGSRQGHIGRLRSDYAGENQECLVSLEFSIGERRYQVDRSPKQEKLKKRGTGTTTAEEIAALYEILPGGPDPKGMGKKRLSSRKSEADQRIRELIGLSPEEFFKIVLLPQGEFAEFLRQNTSQRREVLSKLFPVDFAVRIRELAWNRTREAEALAREAEHTLRELSRQVSFDTYPELHRQAEEALKQARDRAKTLEQENSRLEKILVLENNRRNLEPRLEQARKEAAALEAAASSIQDQEARRDISKQARPLERFLLQETERRRAVTAARADWERVRGALVLAEQRFTNAEAVAAGLPGLEKELAQYGEKRPGLVEMAEEENLLERNQRELAAIRAAMEDCQQNLGALKKALEEKDRIIGERTVLADQAADINERWNRERECKDQLVHLRQQAGEAEELNAEAKTAAARVRRLEAEKAELEKRVPVLREELAGREAEQEGLERAGMAAGLAEGLKPGEPCPVCGSTEHPLPAAARPVQFGLPERIASLGASLKDAERDLTARCTELEAALQECARAERGLDKTRDAMARTAAGFEAAADPGLRDIHTAVNRRDKPLPGMAELGRFVEAKSRELTGLAARQKEARQAGDSAAALYREREGLFARQMALEKEASELGEKHRGLEKITGDMQEKRQRLLLEWKLTGAAEALAALDRAMEDLDRRIRETRENREAAARELAAAKAREEGSARNRNEAEQQHREAAAALDETLSASSFADAEALRAAILDRDTEAALEASVLQWKEDQSRLKSLREELERNLEEIRAERETLGPAPSDPSDPLHPADLQAALKAVIADREATAARRDRASAELAALERDEARLREAKDRHEELSQRAARLAALSDDLSGKNPKKKAFDAWLLGLYLKEVAALASKRLERMSESRYSLILNSEGESGRSLAGLDLAVFDSLTGKTRPCATLSGGESFMASISLALGLADSIQTRSGGVRLDAVFIDEGFGSLDEASLDKALTILDELREHRMVGLISHVGELRSRISSRIEITKTGSGSKIAERMDRLPG